MLRHRRDFLKLLGLAGLGLATPLRAEEPDPTAEVLRSILARDAA